MRSSFIRARTSSRIAADQWLPDHIAPMLATPATALPRDQGSFAFEFKWDGVRTIAYFGLGKLKLLTRSDIDATRRYPELHTLAAAIADHSAILDGEIVALDDVDRPSFSRLQRRMHLTNAVEIAHAVRSVPIFYIIFDILHLDGRLLINEPYSHRREILQGLTTAGACWQVPAPQIGEGDALLDVARANHLEGIVAKRLRSTYRPGVRSRDWLKIKLVGRQEFVIGGWTQESSGLNHIGALLVGYFEPRKSGERALFRYAGKVGSGLTEELQARLRSLLANCARATSPFVDPVPDRPAAFVDPVLVAEIEFRGWTDGGMLRQPVLKGLRFDKKASEVLRE